MTEQEAIAELRAIGHFDLIALADAMEHSAEAALVVATGLPEITLNMIPTAAREILSMVGFL